MTPAASAPSGAVPLLELRGLLLPELEALAARLGEPKYRGRQIARWLYGRGVDEIEAMTDLPQELRVRLSAVARISAPRLRRTQDAGDGSARKYLVVLADDQAVECVLMRFEDGRRSACLS
ncbi:MAG TPA: 23S rRNA (adenine(2503)-C(2))-methyltransferase RlmN, partial [bacterium]|nr:23S rRNA (adenine(2503)-C(2))-methyltransferase RlmN [bacterium]